MTDTQTIITLIGTILATIGGKEAWSYYKARLDIKTKLKMSDNAGETELRNEIRQLLEGKISELKEQVSSLTERIIFMEKERETDKKRIGNQEIKIALLSERLVMKFSSTGKKEKLVDLDNED